MLAMVATGDGALAAGRWSSPPGWRPCDLDHPCDVADRISRTGRHPMVPTAGMVLDVLNTAEVRAMRSASRRVGWRMGTAFASIAALIVVAAGAGWWGLQET